MYMKIFLILILGFNFLYGADFPNRIISLGPTLTEQLYLLNVGDKVIGNTIYCKIPEDAKNKEKVGTVIEQDLEKILTLKPDLVIASSLTNPKTVKKLNNLGIKVVRFRYAKSFNEICDQFLELGKVIGKGKEAKKIIKDVKYKVGLLKKKTIVRNSAKLVPAGLPSNVSIGGLKQGARQKVFVQIGAKPLFTAIKDSFINDFIEFAGGINIANTKTGLYSREEVVAQNPDVIIITTMGIVGDNEKKIWKKYKTINAVKNNRIYIVDSYKLCSPTPVSFAETLKEIVEVLHK